MGVQKSLHLTTYGLNLIFIQSKPIQNFDIGQCEYVPPSREFGGIFVKKFSDIEVGTPSLNFHIFYEKKKKFKQAMKIIVISWIKLRLVLIVNVLPTRQKNVMPSNFIFCRNWSDQPMVYLISTKWNYLYSICFNDVTNFSNVKINRHNWTC